MGSPHSLHVQLSRWNILRALIFSPNAVTALRLATHFDQFERFIAALMATRFSEAAIFLRNSTWHVKLQNLQVGLRVGPPQFAHVDGGRILVILPI